MTKIHFELPKFKELYDSRIWTRGNNIYKAGDVYEAYAIDKNHACCKVKGTIDYTVIITIEDDGYLNAECNCPYFGYCKHEVAALLYISNHPDLELADKKPNQEISELEEYKLYLSELEYDLDHPDFYDDEFDDIDGSETEKKAVEYIDYCECSIATKIDMLILCDQYFGLNQDVWDLIVRLYQEDTAATMNQMIKNANDYPFVQSIADLIEYASKDDISIYENIVKVLLKELSKSKYEKLKSYMLQWYNDNEVIKKIFN